MRPAATWGVDEIDTQISQEYLGNRGNPQFFIDLDRFSWKINGRDMDFHDFPMFLGESGCVSSPPSQVVCRPTAVDMKLVVNGIPQ